MRVLIAMGTVLGAVAGVVGLVWGVGGLLVATPIGHGEPRWGMGAVGVTCATIILGLGKFIISEVADATWVYRLEQRIKAAWAQRKRKPVPLSDLTQHMQKNPERWKDQV